MTGGVYGITVIPYKHGISHTGGIDITMRTKPLPDILRPARRGSKRGWRAVTGELPPEQHDRLLALMARDGRRRTDLVAEALIEYLDRRAA